jgi:maleate isomerase
MSTPYRVGLIVPSSNVTMETEVPALLGRHPAVAGHGVTFHSSRAVLHQVDAESLRRMVTESDRCASELADARLDVVAYACLIAIMADGKGAHEAAERRLAAVLAAAGSPIPVTSSAGALVRTLRRLGARRVAIVAPYLKPLTRVVARYLGDYGIGVVDSVSLEVADNVDVGRLDPARLVDHARSLELKGADAVVLSACVQMPSLAVIDEVSRELELPVLSAATATASEVLALLGEEPVLAGAGAALAPAGRLIRFDPF